MRGKCVDVVPYSHWPTNHFNHICSHSFSTTLIMTATVHSPISHACWLNHLGLWDPSGKNIVTDKWQSEKWCFDWAFRVLRNFRISMLDIGHYIAQTESNSIHIIHLIRRIIIIDIFGNWITLNYITRISYGNGMQVMELSHHILMDTLTALAPTTLLSRWSTWKAAFEPFYR